MVRWCDGGVVKWCDGGVMVVWWCGGGLVRWWGCGEVMVVWCGEVCSDKHKVMVMRWLLCGCCGGV